MAPLSEARSTAETVRDDLKSASEAIFSRGEKLAAEGNAKAHALADDAVEEIAQLVGTLNEKLKAFRTEAKGGADSVESVLGREIRHHPVRTLAIAAGIGILVGALSRR